MAGVVTGWSYASLRLEEFSVYIRGCWSGPHNFFQELRGRVFPVYWSPFEWGTVCFGGFLVTPTVAVDAGIQLSICGGSLISSCKPCLFSGPLQMRSWMRTKEILYIPEKRLYSLTIHCETALQMFLLSSVMRTLLFARWLQLRFTLAYATYSRSISVSDFCLGPSTHLKKFWLGRGPDATLAKSWRLLIGTFLYMV